MQITFKVLCFDDRKVNKKKPATSKRKIGMGEFNDHKTWS